MTDKDVVNEIEANERRAADDEREGGDGPGSLITNTIGSIFRPESEDHPDDDEAAARRAENDADQRPE